MRPGTITQVYTIDDILARAIPEPNTGCWLWERGIQSPGYGCWPVRRGARFAHRMAYEIANGPIPVGMVVCHRCDQPSCVNPDHLFVGTQTDNMRDCADKGRIRLPNISGVAHHSAKLTEAEVRAIRADARSLSTIATSYGLSKSHVGEIKRGASWKHVR